MITPVVETAGNVDIGSRAPDFALMDNLGREWRLSDHRGRVVALLFYPWDESPVCTKQLCSVRDHWSEYQHTRAEIVGVSVGTAESHKKFAEHYSLPMPLLADVRGTVARLFDVKSILGGSQRAVIIIDSEGRIRFRKRVFLCFRPTDDEVLNAIRAAGA